jgi:hypothetical protein
LTVAIRMEPVGVLRCTSLQQNKLALTPGIQHYSNFPGLFLVLSTSPTLLTNYKYSPAKVLEVVTDLESVKGRIVTVVPKKST